MSLPTITYNTDCTCTLQFRAVDSHSFHILVFPCLNDGLSNRPPEGRRERDRDSISDLSELLFRHEMLVRVTSKQENCNATSVVADVEWSDMSPNT
jgi:hypothetical protein